MSSIGRRVAFLALGIVMLGLAFAGGWAVDQGITRAWPDVARLAWVLGLIFTLVVGFAAFAECFHEEENDWLDEDPAPRSGVHFWRIVFFGVGLCAYLLLAILLERRSGVALGSIMLMTSGGGLALLAWFRPAWFWEHPETERLRDVIGNTAVKVVYFGFALAMFCTGMLMASRPAKDLLPVGDLKVTIHRWNADASAEVADTTTISISRTSSGGYVVDGGFSLPDLTGLEIDSAGSSVTTRFGRLDRSAALHLDSRSPLGPWDGVVWSIDESDSLAGRSRKIAFAVARRESQGMGMIYLRARVLEDEIITHGFNYVVYQLE